MLAATWPLPSSRFTRRSEWAVEPAQLPELPVNERKLREIAVCVVLRDSADLQAERAFSCAVRYRFTRERYAIAYNHPADDDELTALIVTLWRHG
jgi:hypothetical protein